MAIIVLSEPFVKHGKTNRYCKAKCPYCGKVWDAIWGSRQRMNSCGCQRPHPSRLRHGNCMKFSGKESGAYTSWRAMRDRCSNPTNKMWDRYGGRGIRVCERWNSFENFLADMGPRPEKGTIERIDPNGHYEYGNCKWTTRAAQNKNKSNNRLLCVYGKTMPMVDWHKVVESDTKYATIKRRLALGWSNKEAIFGKGE